MPFTHEDYEKQFGPGWPDFYTTPADWSACKNLNLEGATPCWHPHCDCQPSAPRRRTNWALVREGFFQGLAAPVNLIADIFRRLR